MQLVRYRSLLDRTGAESVEPVQYRSLLDRTSAESVKPL